MVCKQEPAGAKPPLPGLVKFQVGYQNNTTPVCLAANVLHALWNDRVNHSISDLAAITSSFTTLWATAWSGVAHSFWAMTGVTATSLGGDGLSAFQSSTAPGTVGASAMPPQCSVCVSWRAGITARGGRGRSYLPGLASTALVSTAGAALTTTFASNVKTQFTTFLNSFEGTLIGGQNMLLCIPSYYHSCQLRPIPIAYLVNSVVVHDRVDSQRRRSGKERIYGVT